MLQGLWQKLKHLIRQEVIVVEGMINRPNLTSPSIKGFN